MHERPFHTLPKCDVHVKSELFLSQVVGVRLIRVSSYEVLVTWGDVQSRYKISAVSLFSNQFF